MDEPIETILDKIDDIRVTGRPFGESANEYHALRYLHAGMEQLHYNARKFEDQARGVIDPDGTVKAVYSISIPGLTPYQCMLLTSMFHWYAVSACNYVRLIAAIALKQDPTRPKPVEYARKVLPDVLPFRDKVAAHFSWATQNDKDNNADRMSSVFPSLSWMDDAIYINSFSTTITYLDGSEVTSEVQPWSITKVHKLLRDRYWYPPANDGVPSSSPSSIEL